MDKIALGSDPQRMSEASEFEPDEDQEPELTPEITDDDSDGGGPQLIREIVRVLDEQTEATMVLIQEDDMLYLKSQWREGDDEPHSSPICSFTLDMFTTIALAWLIAKPC